MFFAESLAGAESDGRRESEQCFVIATVSSPIGLPSTELQALDLRRAACTGLRAAVMLAAHARRQNDCAENSAEKNAQKKPAAADDIKSVDVPFPLRSVTVSFTVS